MKDNFPVDEIFTDYAGKKRKFVFSYRHLEELGMYSVYAEELINTDGEGYKFSSSKSNIPHALGDLRQKIRRRLSTRYLSGIFDQPSFSFDEVIGQIGNGGVVIDGKFLSFEQFCEVLQTYEGFLFELKIKDLSNE
jgi:hypothetical protein